jgi:uncharacterized OB-fold protein
MDAIVDGQLRASRCKECADVRFPPRVERCAQCGSSQLEPQTLHDGTVVVAVQSGPEIIAQVRTSVGVTVIGPTSPGTTAGDAVSVVVDGDRAIWTSDG